MIIRQATGGWSRGVASKYKNLLQISTLCSSIARFFLVPESKNINRISFGIEVIKRDISRIAKGND